MGAHTTNCCATLSDCHALQRMLGILGTLALLISAFTPQWYNNRGLWVSQDSLGTEKNNGTTSNSKAQKAQFFFVGVSLVIAVANFCTYLVFCCLKPPEHSQDSQQFPNPAKLFLTILSLSGFCFSVGWAIFTCQHMEMIKKSWTCLGYSYWLGVVAWTLLLFCIPVIFLISECIMYDRQDSAADVTGDTLILDVEPAVSMGVVQTATAL